VRWCGLAGIVLDARIAEVTPSPEQSTTLRDGAEEDGRRIITASRFGYGQEFPPLAAAFITMEA